MNLTNVHFASINFDGFFLHCNNYDYVNDTLFVTKKSNIKRHFLVQGKKKEKKQNDKLYNI